MQGARLDIQSSGHGLDFPSGHTIKWLVFRRV